MKRSRLMGKLISGKGKHRMTRAGFHADVIRALEKFFGQDAVYQWAKGVYEIPEKFVSIAGLGTVPQGIVASFSPEQSEVIVNSKHVDDARVNSLRESLDDISSYHAQSLNLAKEWFL